MRRLAALFCVIAGSFLCDGVSASPTPWVLVEGVDGLGWSGASFPDDFDTGDSLTVVGVIAAFASQIPYDLTQYSATWVASGMEVVGSVVIGTTVIWALEGGTIRMYLDDYPSNHDYGVDPPNSTAPSTFEDGFLLLLDAEIEDSYMRWDDSTDSGAYSANLQLNDGALLPFFNLDPCQSAYLGFDVENDDLPAGYDIRLQGSLMTYGCVSVRESSWGGIKAIYR